MNRLFIIMLIFATALLADDIHFKNGCILTNVTVIDSSGAYYQYKKSNGTLSKINKAIVAKVVKKSFSKNAVTQTTNCADTWKSSATRSMRNATQTKRKTTQTKLNGLMFGLGLVSSALAWDYFDRVGALQDGIDAANKIINNGMSDIIDQGSIDRAKNDKEKLESDKTRNTIIGSVIVAFAIYNYFNAFEKVDLKTDGEKVTLSYNF